MTDQATNEITDFRTAHEAALFNKAHPEHGSRVAELFDLTTKHYGSDLLSEHGSISSRAAAAQSTNTDTLKVSGEKSSDGGQAPLAPDVAKALQYEITAFRNQHSAALYETAHPEHKRRVNELTELTSRLHGDTPANDPVTNFSTKEAAVMEEAMKPLTADELKIGPLDDFGKSLPPYDEWDAATEANARIWMANAEVNEGEARGLQLAFSEGAQHDFSQEYSDANHAKSVSYLRHRYGDEGMSDAIAACNRVIAEIGGAKLQEFKDWLRGTGMGNSPAVVHQVSRIAERKGYITRKGEQP